MLVGARPDKDSFEGNRIGKILGALGLNSFPGCGESLRPEGLSCLVAGVEPRIGDETTPPGRTSPAAEEQAHILKEHPKLLEMVATVAVPTRVSFSALSAYGRCPRRFYLERVLGLTLGAPDPVEAEESDRPGSRVLDEEERHVGRDVGILTHWLLQDLAGSGECPWPGAVRALAERRLHESGLCLSPEELERALRLAVAAWDSPAAEVLSLSSAVREAPFFFALGNTVVSGYMDVVVPGSDGWWVVDYKTNALGGRSVADMAEAYALQADVYCLAALRAGAGTVRMDFVFLESPGDAATAHRDSEDVPCLEKRIGEALSGVEERRFPKRAGKTCDHCPVSRVCDAMAVA